MYGKCYYDGTYGCDLDENADNWKGITKAWKSRINSIKTNITAKVTSY